MRTETVTLLLLVVAAVQAQRPDATPPHILFTPQSYHVGVRETFSFTSYAPERFEVVARVSFDTCTCRNNGVRRCRDRGDVFSEARGMARLGRPVVLEVQMPGFEELQNRNYYVSVTSHNGSVTYLSRRRVSFFNDAFGFLLVKTDKPIYKPSDQVNFCVVHVDKTLKPFSANSSVEVIVRDSKFKQILKLDSVTIGTGSFACLDFPLSEEPNFGNWRIQTTLKIPDEEGGCRVFYSRPSASCNFKVEEFVLPRFEVTLDGPDQLTRDDVSIIGRVTAKYTFGENLQGMVKVNATLVSSQRRESIPFYERTGELRDGMFGFRINTNLLREKVLYRYDPFCVNSRVELVAEVEERGRGTKMADSVSFPLVSNPVSVKLADDNPKHFRPGLNYTLKAVVRGSDGSPGVGLPVRLTATINNDQRSLFNDEIASNNVDGSLTVPISVPLSANCLKITLSPVDQIPGCGSPDVCFSPSPVYSPSRSFLQLEDTSRFSPLKVGGRADIRASSTVEFLTLHLLVIGQGSIQQHTYKVERGGGTSTTISFRVTQDMVPRAKVLGVFARDDGELVADMIELPVQCSLENTVGVSFSQSQASPGDPITLTTSASPNSIVVLSVFDRSLTLLAEACRSLESSNVCRLLRQLTRGSLFGGSSCDNDSPFACCPTSCSEPTRYAVNTFFNAAGVSLQSNMFRPNPPVINPPPTFRPGPFDPRVPEFELRPAPGPVPTTTIPHPAPPTTPSAILPEDGNVVDTEEPGRVRTFFPESWIWAIQRTNASGLTTTDSTVPDTITTWVGEAFALSRQTGLGISPQTQLTVIKPFFVSLELPFSVNFGEAVTITPLVFYFGMGRRGPNGVTARVSVEVDDELSVVENSLDDVEELFVEKGTSANFTLKLRPRALGQLAITISATGERGERDTVRKFLFVKPGCERFEVTQNVLAEGSQQQCFNFTLPSCVIPGSASATITVTGDVMSPPNLDRLLVLPSGCGEQNLVKTATNWVVAEYLHTTEQLSDFIAVKIRNNIQIGYQRELTYLQSSGCFSIWRNGPCSLWLTAAVVNSFSGIVTFYKITDPGREIIDTSVVNGAVNYVVNNQRSDGQIPIIGRVHNYRLLNDNGLVAHTAFGLLSLKQYVETFEGNSEATSTVSRANTAISRAERYLLNQFEEEGDFCNYGLALTTYAILRNARRRQRESSLVTRMVDDLRATITRSRQFPGACFVCNQCPEEEREEADDEGTDCIGRPRSEGSAVCVETTAYTLLALLEAEDDQYTVCLAQWLVRIRSGNGGYWSSQDTVVALQALAEFAEDTYTQDINKEVTFSIPGLDTTKRVISNENRFERFEVEIPSVPSTENCVSWSGNGTAILQTTLEYYGCSCCVDTRSFSLELATVTEETPLGTTLELTIRIRYLKEQSSNMAIVDVEIPSGFIFAGRRFPDEILGSVDERFDVRGSNVIFYFNEVSRREHTTFIVEFIERFTVEDPQQLPVTVYDYYDPGQTVTKYYLPETSSPLPRVTRPPPSTEPPPPATITTPPFFTSTTPPSSLPTRG